MTVFSSLLSNFGLKDLVFKGYPFMWRRGNGHQGGVEEHRFLATTPLLRHFSSYVVDHLPVFILDHVLRLKVGDS